MYLEWYPCQNLSIHKSYLKMEGDLPNNHSVLRMPKIQHRDKLQIVRGGLSTFIYEKNMATTRIVTSDTSLISIVEET